LEKTHGKPTRAFMNKQEPDLNPTPAEIDCAKTKNLFRKRDQSFRWMSGLHISEVAKLR